MPSFGLVSPIYVISLELRVRISSTNSFNLQDIECKMSQDIKLRKYYPSDYDQVVNIYQAGIREANQCAHWSFYNGQFPQLMACEVIAFLCGCFFGIHNLDLKYLGALICGTISTLLLCGLSLWIRRTWTSKQIR